MLKRSKSAHMSPVLVPLPHGTTELCPMCALTRWLDAAIPEGPVFRRSPCPPRCAVMPSLPTAWTPARRASNCGNWQFAGTTVGDGGFDASRNREIGLGAAKTDADRVAPPAPSNTARQARLVRAEILGLEFRKARHFAIQPGKCCRAGSSSLPCPAFCLFAMLGDDPWRLFRFLRSTTASSRLRSMPSDGAGSTACWPLRSTPPPAPLPDWRPAFPAPAP